MGLFGKSKKLPEECKHGIDDAIDDMIAEGLVEVVYDKNGKPMYKATAKLIEKHARDMCESK